MKITKQNYFIKIKELDFTTLPLVLKQCHAVILVKTDQGRDWTKYNNDAEFKSMVDLTFKKLTEYIASKDGILGSAFNNSPKEVLFLSDLPFKSKTDNLALKAAMDYLAIWNLNKARKHILPNSPVIYKPVNAVLGDDTLDIHSIEGTTINKYFLLRELESYFKKNYSVANYKFQVIKNPQEYLPDNSYNQITKMKTKNKGKPLSGTKNENPYANIWKECYFIDRFLAFHGKVLYKNTFGIFIDELQKAIEDKKIRKTSPVAKEIMAMQQAAVKQFNTMYVADYFVLKPTTIKRFNEIVAKWQNASEDVDQEYAKSKKKAKALNGVELVQPSVTSSADYANMKFITIGFTDKWLAFIGDPCAGFKAAVSGMPKMGKTYLCIDFANYLSQNFGKVLYISKEEFLSPTFALKLKDKNAYNKNLDIAGSLPEDLTPYQFIFLDSVTSMKLNVDDLKKLEEKNPGKSFIYVFQVTKAGKARGTNEFMHNVDIIIDVPEKGKAIQYGRYNQGGDMDIFPESLPAAA